MPCLLSKSQLLRAVHVRLQCCGYTHLIQTFPVCISVTDVGNMIAIARAYVKVII